MMQDAVDTVEQFIQYTTCTEPTPQSQIERYQQLLRGIASGSWAFPADFQAWCLLLSQEEEDAK